MFYFHVYFNCVSSQGCTTILLVLRCSRAFLLECANRKAQNKYLLILQLQHLRPQCARIKLPVQIMTPTTTYALIRLTRDGFAIIASVIARSTHAMVWPFLSLVYNIRKTHYITYTPRLLSTHMLCFLCLNTMFIQTLTNTITI